MDVIAFLAGVAFAFAIMARTRTVASTITFKNWAVLGCQHN